MNTPGQNEVNVAAPVYRPAVGMRFMLRGCEFEVCFAEFGMVRYATTKGGKPHQITAERFKALQRAGEFTLTNPALHGQDLVGGTPTAPNLTDGELADALRRTRYAQAALSDLVHPNSKRALAAWIPVFADTIHDNSPPSASAVSGWVRKMRLEGTDALVAPERKRGNRFFRFPPEIEMLVLQAVDAFLEKEEQRDANDVLAYIVGHLAEQNLLTKDGTEVAIPSERTIRRILNRIDPFLLTRLKKGREAAERMARAAGKSITSTRPLMLVQIDTHYLKVFVVDPDTGEVLGKPRLCCVFDVRTRCVVGRYISLLPPCTAATLGALKDMLTRPKRGLPGGVPATIVPDNGVEFRNCAIEELLRRLRVNYEPAKVRDPNGKAHVESFFRTLSLFLIQKIKGTTFSNPDKRGEYPSEERAYATMDQIKEYVDEWIEKEYHCRPHSSTRRAPIRMWQEETANAEPLSFSEGEANALARRPLSSKIRKGRVTVKGLTYYSHALKTLELSWQEMVTVLVDELDLGNVLVTHPFEKGVLIQADSTNPEYTEGLSMWEHEQAKKELAQMTKADVRALGTYAPLLARYKLLLRLQEDSQFARSQVAKFIRSKAKKPVVPEIGGDVLDHTPGASDANSGTSVQGHAADDTQLGLLSNDEGEARESDQSSAEHPSTQDEDALPDIFFRR